jgi:thioesterase domain-containing protein
LNLRHLGEELGPCAQIHAIDSVYLWRSPPPAAEFSVEELAAIYGERILRDFPSIEEFFIGGWSFGGLVALELTRYLAKRGVRAGGVFAIDSALGEGTRSAFTSDAPSPVEALLRRNWLETGYTAGEVDRLLSGGDRAATESLSLCFKAHVKAFAEYQPKPCHAEFELILAQEGTAKDLRSLDAWRQAMGSRMTTSTMPGTHWSVLREPGVRQLAARIRTLIGAKQDAALAAGAGSRQSIEMEE